MTIEDDGFVTVWPSLPAPATFREIVTLNVHEALDLGGQPARVIVGVLAYRALLAVEGMKPRSFGGGGSAVRVSIAGLDLAVDCDRRVPDDEAWVPYLRMWMGRA